MTTTAGVLDAMDVLPTDLPARPNRRMPSMRAIERAHDLRHGYCYRCGQPARCEKAHVIDRVLDGLDNAANIVPLCYPCHSQQIPFSAGQEPIAWAWMQMDVVAYLRAMTRWMAEHKPERIPPDALALFEAMTDAEIEHQWGPLWRFHWGIPKPTDPDVTSLHNLMFSRAEDVAA